MEADNNTKKHYDVVIATPGENVHAEYLKSLLSTIETLNNLGISWKYVNGRSSIVALAREHCLFKAPFNRGIDIDIFDGEFTFGKVFWIDSDMVWTLSDFLAIYNSDKDIISGTALMGDNHQVAIYPKIGMTALNRGAVISLPKSPQKIEGCGFAFLAIKSHVFDLTPKPWFADIEIKITGKSGEEIDWICGSEDIAFCERARRAGFEIWFDPTVRVGHVKNQILTI